MSLANFTILLQAIAAVTAVCAIAGMMKDGPRGRSPLVRFAPGVTLLMAVLLVVLAVAARDGWIHISH